MARSSYDPFDLLEWSPLGLLLTGQLPQQYSSAFKGSLTGATPIDKRVITWSSACPWYVNCYFGSILAILPIKKDHNFHQKRDIRQRWRPQAKLYATIRYSIFTEHLLYDQYCKLYSSGDKTCKAGTEKLTDYVELVAEGVSFTCIRNNRLYKKDKYVVIKLQEATH